MTMAKPVDLRESDATPPAPPGWALRRADPLIMVLGLVVILVLIVLSLAIGSRPIPVSVTWAKLWSPDDTPESIIIWQLRMPRTVLALAIGAALAVAGSVMQALTRNPLAEPGLLGVNAGAAFLVVIAISVFGVTTFAGYVWFAFTGAALAAALVWAVDSRAAMPGQHTRLILAGAALSATLSACTGIITMFNSDTFDSYRFWVVGSLQSREIATLGPVAPFLVVGIVTALLLGRQFNALALGDDLGASLGVKVAVVQLAGFASITLMCGAATAAAGPIGFVGLVVPHAARLLTGTDHPRILRYCLIAGPALVLSSDILGRVIARPGEIEVGIVTAFVGAPVLLYLVLRARKDPA